MSLYNCPIALTIFSGTPQACGVLTHFTPVNRIKCFFEDLKCEGSCRIFFDLIPLINRLIDTVCAIVDQDENRFDFFVEQDPSEAFWL